MTPCRLDDSPGEPKMKAIQRASSSDRSTQPRVGVQKTLVFSPREQEILQLVTRGLTNKEIAVSLDIAVPTVNQFLNRLFLKTGTHNRTQLAVSVVQQYETMSDAYGTKPQAKDDGSLRKQRRPEPKLRSYY